MLVILVGIENEAKLVQPWKVPKPMVLTLVGIEIVVKAEQPKNA